MNKYTIKFETIGKKRPPLRQFDEVAEALGVLPGQLLYAFQHAPIKHPEPRLVTGRKSWYVLGEMRLWWEAIDGSNFAVSERHEYMQNWLKNRAAQSSVTAQTQ